MDMICHYVGIIRFLLPFPVELVNSDPSAALCQHTHTGGCGLGTGGSVTVQHATLGHPWWSSG